MMQRRELLSNDLASQGAKSSSQFSPPNNVEESTMPKGAKSSSHFSPSNNVEESTSPSNEVEESTHRQVQPKRNSKFDYAQFYEEAYKSGYHNDLNYSHGVKVLMRMPQGCLERIITKKQNKKN